MTLGELIRMLEARPPGLRVAAGLGNARRTGSDHIAFDLVGATSVAAMLEATRVAAAITYADYKSGLPGDLIDRPIQLVEGTDGVARAMTAGDVEAMLASPA